MGAITKPVTIWYLELDYLHWQPRQSIPDTQLIIQECCVKQFQFSRFLYQYIGGPWQWTDKLQWSDDEWHSYIENDNIRLWVGYYQGSPAGYFELQKYATHVEINYFGLAEPFIGKGFGSLLLDAAIEAAQQWRRGRVRVNTCSLDHSYALAHYQSRGLQYVESKRCYSDSLL